MRRTTATHHDASRRVTAADFIARARRATSDKPRLVPVWRDVLLDADTPVAAFAKLRHGPFAFLLESAPAGGETWARYTFMGTAPRAAWKLDDGLVHSESLLVDAPQSFGGYEPGNFQSSFHGPVSVSEALQRSLNIPAVDLLDRLGPARLAAQLRSAGLKLRLPAHAEPNLSLILGGGGTTLEESLALWERGEALAKVCQEWLDGARRRLDAAVAEDEEQP